MKAEAERIGDVPGLNFCPSWAAKRRKIFQKGEPTDPRVGWSQASAAGTLQAAG